MKLLLSTQFICLESAIPTKDVSARKVVRVALDVFLRNAYKYVHAKTESNDVCARVCVMCICDACSDVYTRM